MDDGDQLSFPFSEPSRPPPEAPTSPATDESRLAPVVSLSQRRFEAILAKLKALNAAIIARADHLPSSQHSADDSFDVK